MAKKTIMIVGATSAMAEASLKLFIKTGDFDKVVLVARNHDKAELVANDIRVRSENKVEVLTCIIDFNSPKEIATPFWLINDEDVLDTVLIAHGVLINNKDKLELEKASAEVFVTAVSPTLFLEQAIAVMKKHGKGGQIGIIGSVAGDRGRLTNYIYGAAKGYIERYVEGVNHMLRNEGANLFVTLVKPGPTDSPMTAGISGKGKLASVESVASDIVNGIRKHKAVIYTPGKWRLIMLIIRNLPMFVFKKLKI